MRFKVVNYSRLEIRLDTLHICMGQTRLNSCAVCSVHVEALDGTDIRKLAEDFIIRVDVRKNLFGKFPVCLKSIDSRVDILLVTFNWPE